MLPRKLSPNTGMRILYATQEVESKHRYSRFVCFPGSWVQIQVLAFCMLPRKLSPSTGTRVLYASQEVESVYQPSAGTHILYASQEVESVWQENSPVNTTLKYFSARLYPYHLPPSHKFVSREIQTKSTDQLRRENPEWKAVNHPPLRTWRRRLWPLISPRPPPLACHSARFTSSCGAKWFMTWQPFSTLYHVTCFSELKYKQLSPLKKR